MKKKKISFLLAAKWSNFNVDVCFVFFQLHYIFNKQNSIVNLQGFLLLFLSFKIKSDVTMILWSSRQQSFHFSYVGPGTFVSKELSPGVFPPMWIKSPHESGCFSTLFTPNPNQINHGFGFQAHFWASQNVLPKF